MARISKFTREEKRAAVADAASRTQTLAAEEAGVSVNTIGKWKVELAGTRKAAAPPRARKAAPRARGARSAPKLNGSLVDMIREEVDAAVAVAASRAVARYFASLNGRHA